MGVLEKGGNAFDAAVAAGFTLQVVEPHLNGPLGEAPILVYSAKEPALRDDLRPGRGAAGRRRSRIITSLGLDLIPGTGLLAATVPGAFDAWVRLLRDYGTMPLAELIEPAIGYAENGYPLVGRIRDTIMTVAELFRREWTDLRRGLSAGRQPADRRASCSATRRWPRPTAACSPRPKRAAAIASARSTAPATPGTAALSPRRSTVSAAREKVLDSSGRRHNGVLTADDMARWQAPVETPLTYDYRGYTVVKGGPWSQGPVLLQQLALLQGFDLDDLDPVGPDFVHIVTECAKLAYADREAWYGDPDFVDVPMATLLSADYNDARRKLVGERASLDLRPGSPDGREPYVLVGGADVAPAAGIGEPTVGPIGGIGEPTVSELGVVAGDTCHLDIIDRWGNMVSATPSGGWLQSSPVIPELGFCLGTRLQIAWLDERSAVEPRARQAAAQHACRRPWR